MSAHVPSREAMARRAKWGAELTGRNEQTRRRERPKSEEVAGTDATEDVVNLWGFTGRVDSFRLPVEWSH
jgi:hypothetical protein